jgi:L-rhamnose mutarotase
LAKIMRKVEGREGMASYAWVLGVRPGYEEEYKKRHDEIWPEMLDMLSAAGIRNYNIFRHGLTLFGYFETDDLAKTKAAIAASPIDAKWSEWMAPIMKIDVDPTTKFPYLLPLQFHMD